MSGLKLPSDLSGLGLEAPPDSKDSSLLTLCTTLFKNSTFDLVWSLAIIMLTFYHAEESDILGIFLLIPACTNVRICLLLSARFLINFMLLDLLLLFRACCFHAIPLLPTHESQEREILGDTKRLGILRHQTAC